MLLSIGAVQMDTFPFGVDGIDRQAGADFAVKPVMGTLPRREFMGEGDDEITASGQLLPSKIGGLTELEALHDIRRTGAPQPVMRGDGKMLGWFAVTRITEKHEDLDRTGVGFAVQYTVEMVRTGPENASPNTLGVILSLFGALGT